MSTLGDIIAALDKRIKKMAMRKFEMSFAVYDEIEKVHTFIKAASGCGRSDHEIVKMLNNGELDTVFMAVAQVAASVEHDNAPPLPPPPSPKTVYVSRPSKHRYTVRLNYIPTEIHTPLCMKVAPGELRTVSTSTLKIRCIRMVRNVTGCYLKEGKDFLEAVDSLNVNGASLLLLKQMFMAANSLDVSEDLSIHDTMTSWFE